jgi:hypothetical protein
MSIKLILKDKLNSQRINLRTLLKPEQKNQKLANKLKQAGEQKLKKFNKLLMLNLLKTSRKLNI